MRSGQELLAEMQLTIFGLKDTWNIPGPEFFCFSANDDDFTGKKGNLAERKRILDLWKSFDE